MARLYLILVIIVFFTPIVGLESFLLQQDFEIRIGGLSIPIPFSGSLPLLIYSLITWQVLWWLTRWLEKRTGFDVFYWMDQWVRFLHLRERWIYAKRPHISATLALRLARLISFTCIGAVLALGLISEFLLPQLIDFLLPNLINALLARFSGVDWAVSLARWIGGTLIEWLAQIAMSQVRDALAVLLRLNVFTSLLAFSILIWWAEREYQKERIERYRWDIKRVQEQYKREQRDIVVPKAE